MNLLNKMKALEGLLYFKLNMEDIRMNVEILRIENTADNS
jgi:hypothetical protein